MRLLSLLLLLACGSAWGQDTLALTKKPSTDQVASAKEIVKASQQSPTTLAYGGYAIIDVKLEGELESYTVPDSDDCLRTVSIPKTKGYSGWLVSKGDVSPQWTEIAAIATHDRLLVTGVANGKATVIWHGIVNGKSSIIAAFQFVIGKPQPPKPDDPKPDDPKPPIPEQGLRVLFVYETKDLSRLPSAQVQMLTAKKVLDYMDAKCVKAAGDIGYLKADPNANYSALPKVWVDAMDRVLGKKPNGEGKATSFPWLLISNGKDGYEGKWPDNADELLALLKKYGGE